MKNGARNFASRILINVSNLRITQKILVIKKSVTSSLPESLDIKDLEDELLRYSFEKAALSELIYECSTGYIVRVNLAACEMFQQTTNELVAKKWSDLFAGQKEAMEQMHLELLSAGSSSLVVHYPENLEKKISYNINATLFHGKTGKSYAQVTMNPVTTTEMPIQQVPEIRDCKTVNHIPDPYDSGNDGLLQKNDWIKYIASTSYEVTWDWDISSGDIHVGESIHQVLGFVVKNNCMSFKNFVHHISKYDRKRVQEKLKVSLAFHDLYWSDKFKIIKSDNSIADTMARASIIRDAGGVAIRMIGAIQDVSKLYEVDRKLKGQVIYQKGIARNNKEKHLELKKMLAEEIRLKEIGIASAVVDALELQRGEIGRELHDNVNQLLGASRLYLDMARTERGDIDMYLSRSTEYTLSAIEAIRELSKGLTDTISDFGLISDIKKLVTDTMQAQPIILKYVIKENLEKQFNLKFKLNIFRIIQEQVNNILKHAKAQNVIIQLTRNKFAVVLSIADDGMGFDILKHAKGIGLLNIKSRSALFNGAFKIVSKPGEGCSINVVFPINDLLFCAK